jgi:hypothetical protein
MGRLAKLVRARSGYLALSAATEDEREMPRKISLNETLRLSRRTHAAPASIALSDPRRRRATGASLG